MPFPLAFLYVLVRHCCENSIDHLRKHLLFTVTITETEVHHECEIASFDSLTNWHDTHTAHTHTAQTNKQTNKQTHTHTHTHTHT